ncbi:hypothetical protein FOA43_004467 [Brettanomyces nanus]|uniref:Cdc23 domain-containing protein n=1 Tax=Eeniella nana TaxID=13502 RepID=A0A875SC55_EENNA|nr:uncharacterized protein FOA43_004467 [Brettanomyces nanus]QPG77069.1 hypothetical protein FOA43_004467 [Brettanomyces nanus]
MDLRNSLLEAATVLADLHLYQASKWAAEALNGMSPLTQEQIFALSQTKHSSAKKSNQLDPVQLKDAERILLASSYFNCKEFDRCGHVLKGCKSNKAVFLRLYAMYLSGEKRKQFDSDGVLGQKDGKTSNMALSQVLKELSWCKDVSGRLDDPFLLYLAGIVTLKSSNDFRSAQELFYQSLTLYPFNWSCWRELIECLSSFQEAISMVSKFSRNSRFSENRSFHVMVVFFEVVVHQEFFQGSTEVNNHLNFLLQLFPRLSFVKIQQALVCYNALDYQAAESIFDSVLTSDPLRLDDMDTYSNILYVMEKKSKLSFLAQHALKIDPLRPETCCIVANYYSLKFDHQKAIMYYKRALSLDRNCLSAWTLMGHEFVELKNSHAAIESYRRAVDSNNKDFRAWYGLGQAYEVLDMNLYSLYYYQRACELKPTDKRMWQAIGNCCEKLGEFEDAVKSYKKALNVSSETDSSILYKLATLYSEIGDSKNTKSYMIWCLNEEAEEGATDESSKARLWLAKHELEAQNWQQAYKYATDLTYGTSHDIEEARSIAREAGERKSKE